MMVRLKQSVSAAGFFTFVGGLYWLWQLRPEWPRAASDPVPHVLLEAMGVIIGGLFLVARGR